MHCTNGLEGRARDGLGDIDERNGRVIQSGFQGIQGAQPGAGKEKTSIKLEKCKIPFSKRYQNYLYTQLLYV